MSIIQEYRKNFKVVGHHYFPMSQSGELPNFKVEVLNDFEWEERNGSEVTQAIYEAIGDYIQADSELLELAKDRWEDGQGELDGSCPPFNFEEWLLICIEHGVFYGLVELQPNESKHASRELMKFFP